MVGAGKEQEQGKGQGQGPGQGIECYKIILKMLLT